MIFSSLIQLPAILAGKFYNALADQYALLTWRFATQEHGLFIHSFIEEVKVIALSYSTSTINC